LRDGRWIEWDEKGKEIINGVYKKGTPWRGQFENFFYSNGTVAQEYFEYHNDGSKKIVGTFINNKKSGLNGMKMVKKNILGIF
jgi:antitoxin component YwqK of YwqJK toxin-antitoxin module